MDDERVLEDDDDDAEDEEDEEDDDDVDESSSLSSRSVLSLSLSEDIDKGVSRPELVNREGVVGVLR